MVFTKELALKGAGALTAASAASAGLYYALDDDKLCEFDRALIDFLREDGKKNDIVFEVKNGDNEFKATDLTFGSGNSEPKKFTVKATVKVPQDTTNQVFFTTDGSNTTNVASDDSLKKIKELNSNGWTWECNIEFSKTENANKTTIKDDYKKAIFSETNKGLFGILKTKISLQDDENNKWNKYRKAKVEFIKKCGGLREKKVNEEYNNKSKDEASPTITSRIEFKFEGEGENLVPKNKRTFSSWFKREYWEKVN